MRGTVATAVVVGLVGCATAHYDVEPSEIPRPFGDLELNAAGRVQYALLSSGFDVAGCDISDVEFVYREKPWLDVRLGLVAGLFDRGERRIYVAVASSEPNVLEHELIHAYQVCLPVPFRSGHPQELFGPGGVLESL